MKVAIFDNDKEIIILPIIGEKPSRESIGWFDEYFGKESDGKDNPNDYVISIFELDGGLTYSKKDNEVVGWEGLHDDEDWFDYEGELNK